MGGAAAAPRSGVAVGGPTNPKPKTEGKAAAYFHRVTSQMDFCFPFADIDALYFRGI